MELSPSPSPFAVAGPRLLDMGYSVLPIVPGEKCPGHIERRSWRRMDRWTRYCDRHPSSYEMLTWTAYPDAGVGVALGEASGWLVAVDLDYGSAEVRAAIEALLPPSPVRKAGANGYTAFYRGGPEVRSRKFSVDGQSVCELLAHGRQTILPPSRHPAGMAYRWLTEDTLEDLVVSDLPELPDDFADQVEVVLAPHGYRPEKPQRPPREPGAEETIWGEVNAAALADLDAWVPALHLEKCRKANGRYEAVAHWRPSSSGRPLAKRKRNLSIDPLGIRDFGADRGYSPLDLVTAAIGCDLDAAYAWLRERVLPPVEPVILAPRTVEENVPPHDPETGEILEDQLEGPAADPDAELEALTHVPGLLGEMVDWIEGTARKPSRILALGVAIAALGAVMGRRYAGPTGLRTNVYVATQAGSAFGKGHPMKAVKSLFEAANLLHALGAGKIRSDAGLRRAIEQKGSLVYLIDEIGGPLANWLGKTRNASPHLVAVRDILLEFFSNADSVYQGDDYHTGQTDPIFNPNLCLYGTSTPEDFWRAFQGSNVADGFLPRFLVFPLRGRRPPEIEPALPPEPPQSLIEGLQGIVTPARGGNLAGLVHVPGTAKLQAYPVPWGEGALDLWREMAAEQDQAVDEASPAERGMVARRNEHAAKLALILAVGQDAEAPQISAADLAWGRAVADASIAACLPEARDMIADSQHQADYLRVLRMVGEAGERGLSQRELLKKLRGCLEKRRADDILSMLQEAGEIALVSIKPARGRPRMAFVRVE